MRAWRAALLAAVLAVCAVGLLASPADAHALLERSYPAAGASLAHAPRALLLDFTEAPEPSLSTVSLLDSSGRTVPGVGKPTPVPGDSLDLRAALPSLANGVYTVNWRTVSRVDGHVTGGSFAFGIGVQPSSGAYPAKAAGPSTGATPAPAGVAGRWLLYWGLALLLSAGATGPLVFRWRLPRGARSVIAGGWLAAAAGTVTMILAERAAVGVPFTELFRTAAGRSLLAQAVAVAVCGLAAFDAARRAEGPRLVVLGAAAAGALYVHALAGHADTQSPVRLFNVADQWLHMVAAGVWVGGLVWLLLGLRGLDGADRVSAVRRFSQLAFAAVAVIAVTGVLRAVPEVGSPGALVSTSFGVVLLVKSCLFVALMGVAWRSRYRLVPGLTAPATRERRVTGPVARAGSGGQPGVIAGAAAGPPARGGAGIDTLPRRADPPAGTGRADTRPGPGGDAGGARSLRRSVTVEVAVAALVLVAAAVLSGLPPSSFVQAAGRQAAPRAATATGSDFATTVRVRLTASPGTAGPNVFQVQLRRYDSGGPFPARSVQLEFSLPSNPNVSSSLSLHRGAAGTWTGEGTNLSVYGQWDIDVVVQQAATAVDAPLRLRTRLPPENVTVSRQPGVPTLYTVQLGNGRSLQAYMEQLEPGHGVVHFTFFRGQDREASITSATAAAVTPGGADRSLKLIRFDKGHFAANVRITPGRWTFRVEATAADGRTLSGYFSPTVRP
jgi:copper transport protein